MNKEEEYVYIKNLRAGERFVHVQNQKPYIKCDHVITLSDLRTIHTGVGLYDGALTIFQDNEPLLRSEITVHRK